MRDRLAYTAIVARVACELAWTLAVFPVSGRPDLERTHREGPMTATPTPNEIRYREALERIAGAESGLWGRIAREALWPKSNPVEEKEGPNA